MTWIKILSITALLLSLTVTTLDRHDTRRSPLRCVDRTDRGRS